MGPGLFTLSLEGPGPLYLNVTLVPPHVVYLGFRSRPV
jgi:hypothetical protein